MDTIEKLLNDIQRVNHLIILLTYIISPVIGLVAGFITIRINGSLINSQSNPFNLKLKIILTWIVGAVLIGSIPILLGYLFRLTTF